MSMLKKLNEIVFHDLRRLMRDRSIWNSLHITYEHPHVERLWCQHGDLRVFLHRIYPLPTLLEPQHVLYHPHPWPSAVRLVSGRYIHRVGLQDRVMCTQVLGAGASYEITDPDLWHSVEPEGGPSDSIMVIDKPYPIRPSMPHVDVPQKPLSADRFDELFDEWSKRIANG